VVGNRLALPANLQVLDPNDEPLLTLDASGRGSAIELDKPGLYTVAGARGEHALSVLLDAQESDLTLIDTAALDAWQARHGGELVTDSSSEVAGENIGTGVVAGNRAPDPLLLTQGVDASRQSLWQIILPLFVLALLLESWIANRRLDVRRDGS
jgi:hypothetical protein